MNLRSIVLCLCILTQLVNSATVLENRFSVISITISLVYTYFGQFDDVVDKSNVYVDDVVDDVVGDVDDVVDDVVDVVDDVVDYVVDESNDYDVVEANDYYDKSNDYVEPTVVDEVYKANADTYYKCIISLIYSFLIAKFEGTIKSFLVNLMRNYMPQLCIFVDRMRNRRPRLFILIDFLFNPMKYLISFSFILFKSLRNQMRNRMPRLFILVDSLRNRMRNRMPRLFILVERLRNLTMNKPQMNKPELTEEYYRQIVQKYFNNSQDNNRSLTRSRKVEYWDKANKIFDEDANPQTLLERLAEIHQQVIINFLFEKKVCFE